MDQDRVHYGCNLGSPGDAPLGAVRRCGGCQGLLYTVSLRTGVLRWEPVRWWQIRLRVTARLLAGAR